MTATITHPNRPAGTAPGPGDRIDGRPWWRRPIVLLAAVAVFHGVIPLLVLGAHQGFGIDESVYLSQINAHVPAGVFSAPRARGTTLVAAPITLLTNSVVAVRVWLAVLSAVCLFLAYRPWLRLRPGAGVPTAALLFSSIWSVVYYSFEAMPNEWVAFAVLAATGYTLQFMRDGRYRRLIWVGLALAVTALFRPSDAGFAALGLGVACVLVDAPVRRRVWAVAVVAVGTAVGTAEWVIEARSSFGGTVARIHAAQAEQGGGGLRFSGLAQVRTLAGPLLCRSGCTASASFVFWLWWVVGGVLLVLAVAFGRRRWRLGDELFPLVVGLATAAQYLLTVAYAAPRFLIPTYALLALPCASAVVGLLTRVGLGGGVRRPRARLVLTGAVVAALGAQLAVQGDVLVNHIKPATASYNTWMNADAARLEALGVRAPCILLGQPAWNQALAYRAGCTNTPNRTLAVQRAIARGTHVVWLGPGAPPARYAAISRRVRLPAQTPHTTFRAYLILGSGSS